MKVETLVVGPLETNCYIAYFEGSTDCLIIDPGHNGEGIRDYVLNKGLKPLAILLTHGHFDHTGGVPFLKETMDLPVFAEEAEEQTFLDQRISMSHNTIQVDIYLKDGEEKDLGPFHFVTYHTPGHTPGGACYYFPKEQILFSGDSLFAGAVGRSDFPGGDGGALIRSLKEKIMVLPPETHVYPGHMGESDIQTELEMNPFLV